MRDKITLLAGVEEPESTPWAPFDPRAVDFLAALSEAVLHDGETRQQEAACAFGFWCRRSRLEALARRHASPLPRLGRGLAFHLAPSNVPVLFAYTMAIGLLAGNANVVRLSARRVEGEAALLRLLEQMLNRPEHAAVRARTALITYERDNAITAAWCARCDARVIWGGDETVANLRSMPMPPHGVELAFPDRWSLAVLSQRALSDLDGEGLNTLVHRFYNDTYQMDQNACSSPQLVLWLEDGGTPQIRRRWWEALAAEVEARYPFGPFQAARKRERLYLEAMTRTDPPISAVEQYRGNRLYVANLPELPEELDGLRGIFGLFFQCGISALEELAPKLTPKVQTLVCGGLEPRQVARFLAEHHVRGVDRVVPLGQALELDTLWDGKDLIAGLSRVIASEG